MAKILICGLCNKVFLAEVNLIEHLKTHIPLAMHVALAAKSSSSSRNNDGPQNFVSPSVAVCTIKVEICNASLSDGSTPINQISQRQEPAGSESQQMLDQQTIPSLTRRIPEDAIQSREPCPTSDQVNVLRLRRLVAANRYRRKVAFECRVCRRQFNYQTAATKHANHYHAAAAHNQPKPYNFRQSANASRVLPARRIQEKRIAARKQPKQNKKALPSRDAARQADLVDMEADGNNEEAASDDEADRSSSRGNEIVAEEDDEVEMQPSSASADNQATSQAPPRSVASIIEAARTQQQQQHQQQQQQQFLHQQLLLSAVQAERQRLQMAVATTSSTAQLGQPSRILPCPHCPMTFTDVGFLARHVQLHNELQKQQPLLLQQASQNSTQPSQSAFGSIPIPIPGGSIPVSVAPWLTPARLAPASSSQQQQPQPKGPAPAAPTTKTQLVSRPTPLLPPMPSHSQALLMSRPAGPGLLRPRQPLPIPFTALTGLQQQQQQQKLPAGFLPANFIYGGAPANNLAAQRAQLQQTQLTQQPLPMRLMPSIRPQPILAARDHTAAPSSSK